MIAETRRSAALTAVLAVLCVLAAGCGWTTGAEDDAAPAGRSTVLRLVDWGVNDGMLSVRVQNTTDRTLEHASTDIVVTDSQGASTSTGSPEADPCCTILNLPPGGEFGIYIDLGEVADEIAGIDVGYRDVSWLPASAGTSTQLRTGRTRLERDEAQTVVTTRVTAEGAAARVIVGQAFLTGPDGKFLAVVSGRFDCFERDRSRTIQLQLFHDVPAGTEVERVVAYALPDGSPGAVDTCSGP